MYKLAKSHAINMAKDGRVFHTSRYAFEGGECVTGGRGSRKPHDILLSWLKSPGHRQFLMDIRVKLAAVGIAYSRKGTYAAWSFSS